MRMKNLGMAIGMAAATLWMATPAFPQGDVHAGRGQAVYQRWYWIRQKPWHIT